MKARKNSSFIIVYLFTIISLKVVRIFKCDKHRQSKKDIRLILNSENISQFFNIKSITLGTICLLICHDIY